MKELLFVCIGSFFGGGARYLVGKAVQSWVAVSFPWGTMAVNVIGCFLISLLSGLSLGGQISPATKLVLVTGFCGEGYGLEDFRRMMTMLVEREDSQYSYQNTLVAMDADRVVGISVSYDGGRLHELRRAFTEAAKEHIGKDHSGMDDETQAGELYLDSLAVHLEYRRQGIARKLLLATKERANRIGLLCIGLLVDKDNPVGEALYASVGFRYKNDNQWGGHPMKHLVL